MASYEYDSQNDKLNRVAGGTLYADAPIGSYIPFGGTVIPTGWLLCDGRAISRSDYADLFAVIGTAYGSGDGSTTFNIPDMREAVPKGAGLTSKSNNHMDTDGLTVGEFLDDRIQNIKLDPTTNARMTVWRDGTQVPANSPFTYKDTGFSSGTPASVGIFSDLGFDASKNVRAGATTEVKSVGSNYIIKAKQIGVPADFASAIEDVIDEKFSYSTSEVNTGKKWIDGKPIYKKVINFGVLPNNTTKTVNHNISNIRFIVKLEGVATDGTYYIGLPRAGATSTSAVDLYATTTQITLVTRENYSTYTTSYVTLEYTKAD